MQPFSDLDVLDLTQSVAGPTATQYLASLGANVVKIEPPGGDAFREVLEGAFFAAVNNGGKRSLALDLKSDRGQRIACDLAGRADVVVESFRPGVLEQYELDYDSVAAVNDDVVYCSITGFGQSGPRADWPAYDPIIQATSGLMSTIGYPDRPPVRIGASVIDSATGAIAAFAITAAILDREQTGTGEYIDANLFETAVSWMGYWIAHYTGTGDVPMRSGQGFAGLAPNEVFETGDENPFYLACANDMLYERLCRAINREELIDDERYSDPGSRWENRDSLREELQETFETYERDELVDILVDAGVPSGPLQMLDEVVEDDPQVKDREFLIDSYNDWQDVSVKTAKIPFSTSSGRPDIEENPPDLGEHSRSVLQEYGLSDSEIEELVAEGIVVSAD